jgi:hypothetical protein
MTFMSSVGRWSQHLKDIFLWGVLKYKYSPSRRRSIWKIGGRDLGKIVLGIRSRRRCIHQFVNVGGERSGGRIQIKGFNKKGREWGQKGPHLYEGIRPLQEWKVIPPIWGCFWGIWNFYPRGKRSENVFFNIVLNCLHFGVFFGVFFGVKNRG